jgi:hypothetical protein
VYLMFVGTVLVHTGLQCISCLFIRWDNFNGLKCYEGQTGGLERCNGERFGGL